MADHYTTVGLDEKRAGQAGSTSEYCGRRVDESQKKKGQLA
jgi:hypothetical protein